MFKPHSFITKFVAVMLIVVIISTTTILVRPQPARAQLGVPIGTLFNFHSIMSHLKDFVLDRMAVMLANQIIQAITASIVQWINSGFQGSPGFLTDPAGFFLDAADQVTGQFLTGSILSTLCTPFSIDIRLSLALNQTMPAMKRYTCTLSKIVSNVSQIQNTPIYVNGVNINASNNKGNSVSNWINGNFKSGGWGAYTVMATEPQNTLSGAFYAAQSDLQERIVMKQNSIHADLSLGNGFLSWQSCKDVTDQVMAGQYDSQKGLFDSKNANVKTGTTDLGQTTSIQTKTDNSGAVTGYQKCETQTPGSIIGGSLQSSLNIPNEKMVLVKTISDSIDMIMGALVNQMLMMGLHAIVDAAGGGSGSVSYVQKLQNESDSYNSTTTQNALKTEIKNNIATPTSNLENYKKNYDDAITLVTAGRDKYLAAKSCFDNLLSTSTSSTITDVGQRSFLERNSAAINSKLASDVTPLLNDLTAKQQTVANQITEMKLKNFDVSVPQTFDQLHNNANFEYSTTLNNNLAQSTISAASTTIAQADTRTATAQSDKFTKDAATYQNICTTFPASYQSF